MPRLWEYDEFGEPWLENMPLLIVNRKRSKKGKNTMARRRKRHNRRHIRRSPARRRRVNRKRSHRRRNAWTMPGAVASINPRRRHRRGRKNSPRKRHRRMRRNATRLLGITLPPLESVAYGALGYVGTPVIEGFLSTMLPVSITGTTIGKYATRAASVIGLTWLAKMVGLGGRATMIGIGGGMYFLSTAVKEFAGGMLPTAAAAALPMAYYAPPTLRSYSSPTEATYHGGFRTLANGGGLGRLGAPNWGAQNTAASAPFGGARIVGQRFRRFQ